MWLTWRQFRAQAVVGAAMLLLIGTYLIYIGTSIRDSYDSYMAQCAGGDCLRQLTQFQDEYRNLLLYLDGVILLVPLILGIFWGAPLIARELEAGTQRLVWNQSITRRRWLVTKLLLVCLATVVVAGVISALMTWAAHPVDQVANDRFSTVVFGARNLAPVAYAIFAFAFGTTVGLLVRRSIPAMAVTLVVLVVVQIAVPNIVRPNLMSPETTTVPMTAQAINDLRGLGNLRNQPSVKGLTIPDAWVTSVSNLRTADGRDLAVAEFDRCLSSPSSSGPAQNQGRFGATGQCLADLNLHVVASYQPNSRYWTFQLLEFGLYLLFSFALAGVAFWRIQRNVT